LTKPVDNFTRPIMSISNQICIKHGSTRIDTVLSNSLTALLFTLPFSVLILMPSWSVNASVVSKSLFFRGTVQIAFVLWVIINLRTRRYLPQKNPVVFLLAICLAVQVVADLQGINFHHSFWSGLERMGGTIFQLHLLMYVLMISTVLTRDGLWKPWFVCHVVAASGVCLYGYYATFIKSGFHLPGMLDVNDTTILASTLGNRNFTASYLLVVLIIAGILLARSRTAAQKYFFLGCSIFFVISILNTLNRATLLGLMVGSLTAFFILPVLHKRKTPPGKYFFWGGIVLAGMILTIPVLAMWHPDMFWLKRYTLDALFSENPRLLLWKIAWLGFLDRPWLGYGSESFDYVLNAFYLPALWNYGEFWYDHPHNAVIARLISAGISGLIIFLSLWAMLFITVYRQTSSLSVKEQWIWYAGLTAIFVKDLFMFETYADTLVFYTLIGFITVGLPAFVPIANTPKKDPAVKMPFAIPMAALGILIGITGFYFSVVKDIRLNKLLADTVLKKELPLSLRYETANAFYKENDRYIVLPPILFSKLTGSFASNPKVGAAMKEQFAALTRKWLLSSIVRYPEKAKLYVALGEFYAGKGQLQDAAEQFNTALKLSPNRADLWYFKGAVQYHRKQYPAARRAIEKGLVLNPDHDMLQRYQAKLTQNVIERKND
jgi:O-antigen ligase